MRRDHVTLLLDDGTLRRRPSVYGYLSDVLKFNIELVSALVREAQTVTRTLAEQFDVVDDGVLRPPIAFIVPFNFDLVRRVGAEHQRFIGTPFGFSVT